jgi:transposase-like protein
MIVGLSTATTRKEAPAMAGADRMTIEEVVKGVMVREHGDVVRAALEAVCRELMEGEVSELIGAELGERRPDDRLTHRNGYRAGVADAGGHGRAADPQDPSGQLLPVVSGAAPAL